MFKKQNNLMNWYMYTEISKAKNACNWKYSGIWEDGADESFDGVEVDDKNNIVIIEYSFMIQSTEF